jgi:hypothetical protein
MMPTRSSAGPVPLRSCRWVSLVVFALVGLAACGKTASPTPSPTATSAPLGQVAAATRSPDATTGASPATGELTVGQLADRIAAAWPSVRTFRETTVSTPFQRASPVALASPRPNATLVVAPGTNTTIDDNVLPDRRHITQFVNGQPVVEFVVVGGKIYARGSQVPGVTPVADPNAWFVVDPSSLAASSPYAATYSALAKPVAAPYGGLSAAERGRIAHPAGTLRADGRSCDAYRTVDTTQTGERIDITIAIDATGLLCSIETRAGGTDTVTTFTFNLDLTIDAPIR